MASAAEHLASRVAGRHPELPETTAGTLRLDIRVNGHTDHWYLTIHDQKVDVSRSSAEADLVVAADRAVFDGLAAGRAHIGSALLRNDVYARGDLRLLMLLRRLFPGPPDARHPRTSGLTGEAAG
ncbi:SCP2 sterol-binding domain-containing protein [Micromonospora sp. PLK6-60]|uniref:SCP2 sterol-binding domain-containing protein n=1 Tax=Micromonospora sp. PLK6-60 TaxID=2873383 RepID=UPI001CA79053|nr:SCP2 sterol-binding domain-containing protein [Micromonospora sp. PLK6-60]MBY8874767.1 SCP2 sterol-binding domain-containing protein [Micromonospora sp. PLK6-60]